MFENIKFAIIMININIEDEFSKLNTVVIGIANDFGGTPNLEACYDPKSMQHVKEGTFPSEKDCIDELNALYEVLIRYGVQVFRPRNINGLNQIFPRDIAFAIDDTLVISNIIKDRKDEILAIEQLLGQIPKHKILKPPLDVRIEGGDVILSNNFIFVGYSDESDFQRYKVSRTNLQSLSFLSSRFPNKIVKGFELNKSDHDPKENALHLDCCFQPIGQGMAILYKDGFKNKQDIDFIINHFGHLNIIEIDKEEMYNMNSNIFSISEKIIVSEKGFSRLNQELRNRNFIVEEIPYSEIAKMEGLLRCSTMPLNRE